MHRLHLFSYTQRINSYQKINMEKAIASLVKIFQLIICGCFKIQQTIKTKNKPGGALTMTMVVSRETFISNSGHRLRTPGFLLVIGS